MLPQFGYIVAQAGADSHPHPPTVIPPPLTNKQQRSPLPFPPVHHPRSPKEPQRIAPQPTLEDPSFYTIPYYARHHSSPPPPLPPPPPTAAASAAGTASTTAAPPPSLPSSSSSSASTATTTTTTTAQAALTATGTGTSTGATTSAATSVATGATNSHHSHHNHLPPPIPYMYAPSAPPTDDYYSKSSYYPYDRPSDSPQGFQSLQTYPPISPWQEPKLSNDLYRPVSSIWHTPQPHHDSPPKFTFHDHDDPYHPQYGNQWQDEPTHVHHDKMLSRLRGFNELMAWMDSEFIEQSEEIYQDKLKSLQEELQSIQEGTHSLFKEAVTDLEQKRDKTIQDAALVSTYQLSLAQTQLDKDMTTIDSNYEQEQNTLHDTLMTAIDERRKQIKEDKEDEKDVCHDLFRDVSTRISHKRSLRRRTPFDRQTVSPSSRHESRRRQNRISTLHNIHASPSSKESAELANDFMSMKARRPGSLNSVSRRC